MHFSYSLFYVLPAVIAVVSIRVVVWPQIVRNYIVWVVLRPRLIIRVRARLISKIIWRHIRVRHIGRPNRLLSIWLARRKPLIWIWVNLRTRRLRIYRSSALIRLRHRSHWLRAILRLRLLILHRRARSLRVLPVHWVKIRLIWINSAVWSHIVVWILRRNHIRVVVLSRLPKERLSHILRPWLLIEIRLRVDLSWLRNRARRLLSKRLLRGHSGLPKAWLRLPKRLRGLLNCRWNRLNRIATVRVRQNFAFCRASRGRLVWVRAQRLRHRRARFSQSLGTALICSGEFGWAQRIVF